MLVFIDESGDTGLKVNKGSSRYFVLALVVFEENEEAIACDKKIESLKEAWGLPAKYEFKFSKLRKEQRLKFLETVFPHNFFYFGMVIDKGSERLRRDWFKGQETFYNYACGLAFESAKPYLNEATIIVDGSGSRRFKQKFQKYLKTKMGSEIIKKVKIQVSHTNNLIQLADMIAGAIHKNFTQRQDAKLYREAISAKEIDVLVYPK